MTVSWFRIPAYAKNKIKRDDRNEKRPKQYADPKLDDDGKNLVRSIIKRLRGVITQSSLVNVQKNKISNNYGVVGAKFNSSVVVK